jgi:hypothetical protein
MTDRAQFEAMLNALINEDQEAAKEIFHNIVVAKSRQIYGELLESDFSSEEEEEEGSEAKAPKDTGNPYEEESSEEEGEEEEEEGSEEESGEEEGEDDGEENPFGGEDDGEEEGEEDGEGDMEDRVMDLEDALEDLKAEFEQLLAGEEHEEEQNPDIHGGELDGLPGMDGEEGEGEMDEFAGLMEYTIKVPSPKHGDNGVSTKSIVASKNDMGGTAGNLAQNFSTTSGGTKGGLLAPTTKEDNAGNINTATAPKGGKAFSTKVPAGHGAEKAGSKESADNKTSLIGKKVR